MTDEYRHGWTDAKVKKECDGCGGKLSGDHVDRYLLDLFDDMHKDCVVTSNEQVTGA